MSISKMTSLFATTADKTSIYIFYFTLIQTVQKQFLDSDISPLSCVQLDSAMSLIQAAKNLMNAVVSTVKASYVASTKYQKNKNMEALNMPAVSWRMKAPEKKPLVKREKQDDGQTNRVKRSSHKKHVNPVQALSEFKAMDSI